MLIDDVKTALRTTTTNQMFVDQIQLLIESAKEDLVLGGVDPSWTTSESDSLIKQCIISYVCWLYFNDIDKVESDKWLNIYNLHRQKIHNRSKYEGCSHDL